jgi:hypothetical protein
VDTIEFIVRTGEPDGRQRGIRILINGRDLVEIVRVHEEPFAKREGHPEIAGAYAGLPADQYTCLPSRHFLGEPRWALYQVGSKVHVLGCECGEPGCWPLLCEIEATSDRVVWRNFEQPHRRANHPSGPWDYEGMGPFEFDRQAYEAALERLSADRD